MELQSDGKLVVVGRIIERTNLRIPKKIVRLNTDGSTDYSFTVPSLDEVSYVSDIAIQSTGKILVGGNLQINGVAKHVIRLNNDGSIDNSFIQGNAFTTASYAIQDIKIQDDDKILCVGSFSAFNGVQRRGVIRLNVDGSVDMGYNVASGGIETSGQVRNIEVLANGKSVIVGEFATYNGVNRGRIARINNDGSLDMGFDSSLGFTEGRPLHSATQADGKIVVVGEFSSYANVLKRLIIRLNTDGSIDNSFEAVNPQPAVSGQVEVLSSGKILTSIIFSGAEIERLNQDGSWDSTFNVSYGANNKLHQIVRFPSNKMAILGKGEFGRYNNHIANPIIKINEDGSVDAGFSFVETNLSQIPLGSFINRIEVIAAQNEKLLLAGSFSATSLMTTTKILRLNEDGSKDLSFDATSVFPLTSFSSLTTMKVQADGKIIVGGYGINGSNDYGMVRLNSNGTRDNSFTWSNIDGGGEIKQIEIQDDGKILLGGFFTSYGGNSAVSLMRLLPDGTFDTTFSPNFSTSFISTINQVSNGDIIVSGRFNSSFPNPSFFRVLKINSNGIIYPTLDVSLQSNATINKVIPQSNGEIVIAGQFNQLQGNPVRNIGRVNADGSFDFNFNTTGTDTTIRDAVALPNSIVIVGDFLEYNGIGRNRIAKITNQVALVTNETPPNQQTRICRNTTTNLIATGTGNTFWYDSPTNPTPIYVGDTLTTPLITADSTYFYAQDSIVGCGTSNRLSILVTASDTAYTNAQNIIAYLDSLGNVEISAIQLDSLSRPACNDTIVSYTFRDTGLETRSYSCADTNTMHEVWLQITNNNGNIDTAQAFIQVRDTIAPVVQTQPFAVSLASNTSSVTVSALDLIYSLSDNCTDSTNITVVFANTGLTTQDFSCGNFNNTNLRITDNAGNSIIVPTTIISTDYDLDINLIAWTFRPAEYTYIGLEGINRYCLPVSGQIQVTLDSLTEYSSLYYNFNPPTSIVGNILTWNFSNLAEALPRFRSGFYVRTRNSANIGDQVCFTVKITPTSGDTNLANNNKTYCYNVVNSYDPNDKQVYPQGICTDKFTKRSDLPLTYTIRFQNTGNAPALNVRIADSLSTLLNRRSLRIVGTSHPMVVDTVAGNNVINFRFNNINLPDSSSNPALSQGYVIFELSEIAAHTDTSRISNKSYIYFDTNAPIITNTVKNTIVNTLPNCTVGTPNPPIAACTLPTNLRAEILTSTKVKLAWTNPAGTNAINYEILRNGQRLITVPASNLSYIDSTLIANTQYNYSIKAICGNSVATSNVVQVRTIPATPILLSVVAACKGTTGKINVQSAGATYRVYSSQTATTPLFETNNASIETPILNDSTTFYISVVIGGQESQRVKAVVPIKEVFDAIVEQGVLFETCATEFNLSAKNVVGATYTWFRENVEVGTGRTLTTTFAARYKVRVIKNGCFSDSEFTTSRFVSAPTAKIKQGTAITFCGSGTLNAQDTSANVVYTWSLNGTNVGNGTAINISQSGTYTLKASQPSCESSVTINVTITNAPANVALTASKTAICTDTQTTLSVTTGTGFIYKWFRNNVAISNTFSTLSTSEIGKYKVEITTAEGCKVTTSEVEISRLDVKQATLRINTESGKDKTIDVTSQDVIDSVQWFKEGVLIPAFANQKIITPTQTGNYKAKVTYSTGCKSETTEKMFTIGGVTGIEEESAKIFTIYPNPNMGSFKIEFATTTNQQTRLTLVDGLGRIIHTQEIAMNQKTTSITLPKISAGVYVVQIISNGKVYTKQLIIQ